MYPDINYERHTSYVTGLQRTIDLVEEEKKRVEMGYFDTRGEHPIFGHPIFDDNQRTRLAQDDPQKVSPDRYNVRTRRDLGLTFDAAIPSAENVFINEAGNMVLRASWLDAPEPRPKSHTGVTQLTHRTGYVDHNILPKDGDHRIYAFQDRLTHQRYGRWEIRAKVPTGPNTRGTLAAFWLRNGSTGEIDIMESWGQGGEMHPDYPKYKLGRSEFTTFQNSGTAAEKSFWRHEDQLGFRRGENLVYDDFHTWAFEWTPDYMASYLDDRCTKFITPKDTTLELVSPGDDKMVLVSAQKYWADPAYQSPWHIRINLHVGAHPTWWGLPDPEHREWTQDDLDYEIEHVRIWALP